MSPSELRVCSRCGRALAPEMPLGLCVRCALVDVENEAEPTAAREPLHTEDPGLIPYDFGQCQVIGRYKLLEKLGEGGCGVVYVAEQKEPIHRRVALKVIKLGMDTRAVVARFEAERQALAMMDHPNIAKVLDAGATEAGRPYFVMELERGTRITDYCDEARLGTRDRLGLFVAVCQAIQHAHQKGIIHRDIKPSNILVTVNNGVAVPKVIDFGIAKATEGRLTDKTIYTQLHQLLGTPAYMSPEQAEMTGLDIDTRSDIYSLGVLLYELLTGALPLDPKELAAAGLDGLRRTIREREPSRPSTRLANLPGAELTTLAKRRSIEGPKLVLSVKGDLDWIVMRCLEKDRTRRYQSASSLAEDIQRHLNTEPVMARPPSAADRIQKMVRRHRTAFAAVVAVTVALMVGFSAAVIGWVQAVRAKSEEAKLRKQAQELEQVSRRRAYAAEMNTAFNSLAANNLGHVLQLLDRQRPRSGEEDLRGFEWRCLWQQARGNELVSWTPEVCQSCAYSANGEFLAYGGQNIVIRNATTKSNIITLPVRTASLCFSPNGALLATADSSFVSIWDTRTWRQVHSLANTRYPVRFSPDGRFLLTGTEEGYRLWETEKWQAVGLAPTGPPPHGGPGQNLISISPDSLYLLTPSSRDTFNPHQIRVWGIPTMRELEPLETGDPVQTGELAAATFSADGSQLILGRVNGQVQVWDFKRRILVKTWNAHRSHVTCLGVSADGKWLATGSNDHTVRWWDMASSEQVCQIGVHVGEVTSLAVSPDASEVLSGASFPPEVKLLSTSPHQEAPRLNGADLIIGFIDPARLLVGYSPNGLAIWNLTNGSAESLPFSRAVDMSDWNNPCAIKPDGSVLTIGLADGSIESWNLASRTEVSKWQAHSDRVRAVRFSTDGRTLATGGKKEGVKVWEAANLKELANFPLGEKDILGCSFSPVENILAANGSFGFVVWDLNTHQEIFGSEVQGSRVPTAEFSPDGTLLAVAAGAQNEVHLWDMKTRTLKTVLKGLLGGTWNLAFSPDGKTLASNGLQVKLWNISTLQEVATIGGDGYVAWGLAFSPDGQALAAAYGTPNKYVTLWRAPSLEKIEEAEAQQKFSIHRGEQ